MTTFFYLIQIEQVSTSASYSCVQFTDKNEEEKSTTPSKNAADLSYLLDTTKKTKKKSIQYVFLFYKLSNNNFEHFVMKIFTFFTELL